MPGLNLANLPLTPRTATPAEEQRARRAFANLLAGHPSLSPVTRAIYGDWYPTVTLAGLAYAIGGPATLNTLHTGLTGCDAEYAALFAAQPPAPSCGPGLDDTYLLPPWILPSYLPTGLSLLCARPGADAATLALQWALEVACQHQPARPGAFYITCREPIPAVRRRLDALHPAPDLPLQLAANLPLRDPSALDALAEVLEQHRLVVVDGLRQSLGLDPSPARRKVAAAQPPLPPPAVDDLHQLLARLHALVMVSNSAILLVDDHLYPRPIGSTVDNIDSIDDALIDSVDDTLGAALFAADSACQLENVLTLTRRQGAPHGLVTSPELAHPVVVAFPRCRGDRPQRVTGRTLVPCARADPTPKLTAWTLSELVHTDFLPPEFVVYGLLPVGLSNLAGRPKVGKSLLANQIAVAIDAGCEVLGRAVRQSPVFYLALEDSPSRLSARLKKLIQARGIAIPPPAGGLNTVLDASIDDQTCGIGYSVGSAAAANSSTGSIGSSKFVIGCRLLGEGGLEQIESVFAEGFGVAVIDTFSRACGRADQNDSADMTMLMGALQRMALDHHAAILLVDHHRKSARASPDTDPIDDIMGSTAKAGVVDCALGLYRRHNEAEGLLKLRGRDFGDTQIPLAWDAASFTWQLRAGGEEAGAAGAPGAAAARFTARDYATIAAVEELGPATLSQIMAVTGAAKGNLYNRLAALCRRESLIRRGCGKGTLYCLPQDEPACDPEVTGVMEVMEVIDAGDTEDGADA